MAQKYLKNIIYSEYSSFVRCIGNKDSLSICGFLLQSFEYFFSCAETFQISEVKLSIFVLNSWQMESYSGKRQKQLRNVQSGRNSLPQERTDHFIIQFQMVIPNTFIQVTDQTDVYRLDRFYLEIPIPICICL